MPDSDSVEALDVQLNKLRSNISDLGFQFDYYKTKTAAALGVGVFLTFLAILAVIDLAPGKGSAWLTLGITRETLGWMAAGLGVSAGFLLMVGFRRLRRSDTGVRSKLDSMEREYMELLERRDAAARSNP